MTIESRGPEMPIEDIDSELLRLLETVKGLIEDLQRLAEKVHSETSARKH